MFSGEVVFQVTRRMLYRALLIGTVLVLIVVFARPVPAQKVQENYKDKFKIAEDIGGVAIAASADGRYVYIAGKKGVLVSDDYGKTGSWVQTVRMK